MRLNANRGADRWTTGAANRSQANIVDLGIGAPHAASSDADLELPRQVVKIAIANEKLIGLERQLRGVTNLVGIHSRERAAGNVASVVAA